tara:strand:- start:39614 stop:40897 length:1284 start_codon:yes stop_codon:yes gene_type:complete
MADDIDNKIFNAAKLGRSYVKQGKSGKQLGDAAVAKYKEKILEGEPKGTTFEFDPEEEAKVRAKSSLGHVIYGPDGSDAKGNAGFTISFQHVPSEKSVYFKAFLTAFNETFKPEWASETVYGRADPIYMFKSIVRTISVGLMVPAATEGEGFENLGKVQDLIQFLYPSYTDPTNALSITQSPLVRLKVMNLATRGSAGALGGAHDLGAMPHAPYQLFNSNKAEDGLMGEIGNLTINHNIENLDLGSFEINNGTIIPKAIELQFDFTVIHEHHLGWDWRDKFSAPYFPYDLDLHGEEQRKKDEAALKATLSEAVKALEAIPVQELEASLAQLEDTAAQLELKRKKLETQAQLDQAKALMLRNLGDLAGPRRIVHPAYRAPPPTTPDAPIGDALDDLDTSELPDDFVSGGGANYTRGREEKWGGSKKYE